MQGWVFVAPAADAVLDAVPLPVRLLLPTRKVCVAEAVPFVLIVVLDALRVLLLAADAEAERIAMLSVGCDKIMADV